MINFDPKLDLRMERVVPVSPELVWKAWTEPQHLKKWFCPKPWFVSECEVDLRPGGIMSFTMNGPEGQVMPNVGKYLEVVPNRRLVWTDALLPGFRPSGKGFMTGVIELTAEGTGTRYVAMALHADENAREQHAAMGFEEGWGKALDQLVELMQGQ